MDNTFKTFALGFIIMIILFAIAFKKESDESDAAGKLPDVISIQNDKNTICAKDKYNRKSCFTEIEFEHSYCYIDSTGFSAKVTPLSCIKKDK